MFSPILINRLKEPKSGMLVMSTVGSNSPRSAIPDSLTGYAGGIDKKTKLLALEQAGIAR